ncbi:MAG: aldolase/citrate lyase family protein, partial [Pseudomonadota bacterium]
LISRALDAGAQAIVCPMVNSVADAQALVDAAKYPPLGGRSWGPYRAGMMIDGDPLVEANTWSLTFAQIETGEALEEADAILAVEGIDGVVVGPNDLAISVRGDREIDAPDMVDNVQKIQAACARHGKLSWIFANTVAYGRARRDEGWDILTVSTEQRLLSQAFADTRAALFAD